MDLLTESDPPNNQEELVLDQLLVFGYASKIYRDDEKAHWIDEGRHLIPLLGDSSVLIDRYDGRGALVDIKACESLGSNTPVLTYEEQEVEKLCDMERYWDCKDDDLENNDGGEGELENSKRTSTKYAAFEYTYDLPENTNSKDKRSDLDYTPPLDLYLPPDLVLPKTMKSHAIIEKTAKFISTHGTQMEIILKTKQANNPMFNFLTFNDELHPYYRYLVIALKANAYKPQETSLEDNSPHTSDSEDDHYLHPSLAPKSTISSPKEQTLESSSSFKYKPTGPSAYTALVSKIQDMERPFVAESEISMVWKAPDLNSNSSEEPDSQTQPANMMPTGDTQVIIEKMASYVVKNGQAFESLACTKGDPRFTFLDESDPYHWYYISCKHHFQSKNGGVVVAGEFKPYNSESESSKQPSSKNLSSSRFHLEKSPPVSSVVPLPNHANALNRMATLPPALIDKIEQLRKKTLENRAKGLDLKESVDNLPLPVSSPSYTPQPQDHKPVVFGPQSYPVDEGEEERKRKAERKKKAALFIQKMKIQEQAQPLPITTIVESCDDVEIVGEVRRVNILPDEKQKLSESDSDVEEIKRVSPEIRSEVQSKHQNDSTDTDSNSEEENYSKHKKRGRYFSNSDSEEGGKLHKSSRKKSKKKRKKKSSKKKSRNH